MKKFIPARTYLGETHYINPDKIARIFSKIFPGEKFYKYYIEVDIGGNHFTAYEILEEDYTDLINMKR